MRIWLYIPGAHPRMESLILHAEGSKCRSLERHLQRCARCREAAALLKGAVQPSREPEPCDAQLLSEIFENLQLQMRAWCSLAGFTAGTRTRKRRFPRLMEAIEFYFGKEAAIRIDGCARWNAADHWELIPVTRPLFNTFLGRKAADALVQKITGAAL